MLSPSGPSVMETWKGPVVGELTMLGEGEVTTVGGGVRVVWADALLIQGNPKINPSAIQVLMTWRHLSSLVLRGLRFGQPGEAPFECFSPCSSSSLARLTDSL